MCLRLHAYQPLSASVLQGWQGWDDYAPSDGVKQFLLTTLRILIVVVGTFSLVAMIATGSVLATIITGVLAVLALHLFVADDSISHIVPARLPPRRVHSVVIPVLPNTPSVSYSYGYSPPLTRTVSPVHIQYAYPQANERAILGQRGHHYGVRERRGTPVPAYHLSHSHHSQRAQHHHASHAAPHSYGTRYHHGDPTERAILGERA